jgi:hypothetical protein
MHVYHEAGIILTLFAYWSLPSLVNGIDYLRDASPTATFIAQAALDCPGCRHLYTMGVLEPGAVSVHWPGVVPVGSSFPVHAPAWWNGDGTTIISGTGNAVYAMFTGLPFAVIAAGFWARLAMWAGRMARWRRSART